MDKLREKIEAVNNGFLKAFNLGDLGKAMRVYSDDAVILPPNADMMKGRKAITAYWKAGLEMGIKEANLETVEVTPVGENYAYEIGKYELKIEPSNGQMITDHGKYLMVWKLVEGEWKWHSDAWNTSLPPA